GTGFRSGAGGSPTAAAGGFPTLRRLALGRRLIATLELESGFNDAPAVIVVGLLSGGTAFDGPGPVLHALALTGYELVAGALVGAAAGWLGVQVLRPSPLPVAALFPPPPIPFPLAS